MTRLTNPSRMDMIKNENTKCYQQARLSRDVRFDGKFFVAVKTTGIYCRPICPAVTPKEENIEYYSQAHLAAKAGYRPCFRCRPDSAPGSPVWKGADTTLERAKRLIDNGALEQGSLGDLSSRLGIGDRYLRQLFDKYLGISPKSYALFRQCEFAKNLLHQTALPITDIAFASGFKSIRRFNDCFKKQLSFNPSEVRKQKTISNNTLILKLYYRPPYNWNHLHHFFSARVIEGLEWVDDNAYGRTFCWQNKQGSCKGEFTAFHNQAHHRFDVHIEIDNMHLLKPVVNNIRRILDLDTDSETIEQHLDLAGFKNIATGLRLPGTWSVFEAGIRAVLGQQISVVAARKLVRKVICELGEVRGNTKGNLKDNKRYPIKNNAKEDINEGANENKKIYFPSALSIAESDFSFLKMPGRRKQTLIDLGQYHLDNPFDSNPDDWLPIKGIGPWTVDYAKMRGLSDPDIYLGGDLGVKKALEKAMQEPMQESSVKKSSTFTDPTFTDPATTAPFRSYLTFQLWNQL